MATDEKIIRKYKRIYPERATYEDVAICSGDFEKGFVVKIKLFELPESFEEQRLLSLGDFLQISARLVETNEELTARETSDGYGAYAQGGVCPVLEAKLFLESEEHPDWKEIRLGLPLTKFPPSDTFYLQYDGVKFRWIYRGEEANYDYPFGSLKRGNGQNFVDSERIESGVSFVKLLFEEEKEEIIPNGIRFYSPRGFNTWVGDIVNCYQDGKYFLVYLYDSHHHGNRFGGGAHTPALLTTEDFITWTDYGRMYELEAQWQTFGTGTLFFQNGKFYYTHGFHTSRFLPDHRLIGAEIQKAYEQTGETMPKRYDEIFAEGKYPNGSNYMFSEDGVRYVPARTQFHWSENPSVYVREEGRLVMYAGYGACGTWQAEAIDGPWRQTDKNFPPVFTDSKLRYSSECPCLFEWNGYRYMIIGFLGYLRTEKNSADFVEVGADGEDVYDGLCVPMAVKTSDHRVILSGWIQHVGWASLLLHRELLQRENGRLDMRWLPEHIPNTNGKTPLIERETGEWALEKTKSYYLSCSVLPEDDGVVQIVLSGEGEGCALTLDAKEELAEIRGANNDFCEGYLPPAYLAAPKFFQKEAAEGRAYTDGRAIPHIHCRSKDFSLAKMDMLKNEYTLRLIVHYEQKTGDVFIDAELGGKRTLASARVGLKVTSLTLLSKHAALKDVALFEL